ncbi:MAG: hypothetical protein KC493_08225 [Bacteriovoracaceae bacterium]|nr:hypothetical protein [Bacteriovoracaceae bacterium]
MDKSAVGKWVEIELVNGKIWVGFLEEWDEDAVFITNGIKFGETDFKGAECAPEEVTKVEETEKRDFVIE